MAGFQGREAHAPHAQCKSVGGRHRVCENQGANVCQTPTASAPVLKENSESGLHLEWHLLWTHSLKMGKKEPTRWWHPTSIDSQLRKTVVHRVCVLPYIIWWHFRQNQDWNPGSLLLGLDITWVLYPHSAPLIRRGDVPRPLADA